MLKESFKIDWMIEGQFKQLGLTEERAGYLSGKNQVKHNMTRTVALSLGKANQDKNRSGAVQ